MNISKSRKTAWKFFASQSKLSEGQVSLFKICWLCGKVGGKVELHHDDYSKPTMVVPLCTRCHILKHKEERARGINKMYELKREGLLKSRW